MLSHESDPTGKLMRALYYARAAIHLRTPLGKDASTIDPTRRSEDIAQLEKLP